MLRALPWVLAKREPFIILRVLALDIGEVRIGIAVSDAAGTVASPLKVLPAAEVIQGAKSFRYVLEDYEPELLLCGLPLSLSGEESEQTRKIRTCAQLIASESGLPLHFQDERLSSSEAKRILREQGYSEKEMRGKVDMIAASIFLQAYLDSCKNVSGNKADCEEKR